VDRLGRSLQDLLGTLGELRSAASLSPMSIAELDAFLASERGKRANDAKPVMDATPLLEGEATRLDVGQADGAAE
jgi:hypothetical protein